VHCVSTVVCVKYGRSSHTQTVHVPIRTALSNSLGGARWALSGMPSPLLFLFGRIPSNYLFGLETTGQRKTEKRKEKFTNQNGKANERNQFSHRWFGPVCVFYMQNTYNLSVDKKNQLDVTFCILYFSSNSCSTCSGNHAPIIRSWRLRDVIASCWYVPWLQGGCQDRLAGSASIGRTACQPVLTTSLQPRNIPTRGYNITQSSAPDDGHMVARNMLSNY
jgi:hypothetical protein